MVLEFQKSVFVDNAVDSTRLTPASACLCLCLCPRVLVIGHAEVQHVHVPPLKSFSVTTSDLKAFRGQMYGLIDQCSTYIEDLDQRPVWARVFSFPTTLRGSRIYET